MQAYQKLRAAADTDIPSQLAKDVVDAEQRMDSYLAACPDCRFVTAKFADRFFAGSLNLRDAGMVENPTDVWSCPTCRRVVADKSS